MAHQWNEVIAEMLQFVPELEPDCRPEVRAALDKSLRYLGHSASDEDVIYLRELQRTHSHAIKDSIYAPGHYIIFESLLMPMLIHLSSDETERKRFAQIMNWLEELASSDDVKVQNLVAIGICENLLGSHQQHLGRFFSAMGGTMRQMCRDFIPFFRLDEKSTAILSAK